MLRRLQKRRNAGARHFATCNSCYQDISGVRYKCVDEQCPDYDLCAKCEALPIPIHPPTHSMLKIKVASGPAFPTQHATDVAAMFTANQERHGATCDNCADAIHGVRYKCMHADCLDYDICPRCEAGPERPHPLNHPLLKVMTADTIIPKVMRPGQRMTVSMIVEEVHDYDGNPWDI